MDGGPLEMPGSCRDVITAPSVVLALTAVIGTAAMLWDDDRARICAEQARRTAEYIVATRARATTSWCGDWRQTCICCQAGGQRAASSFRSHCSRRASQTLHS